MRTNKMIGTKLFILGYLWSIPESQWVPNRWKSSRECAKCYNRAQTAKKDVNEQLDPTPRQVTLSEPALKKASLGKLTFIGVAIGGDRDRAPRDSPSASSRSTTSINASTTCRSSRRPTGSDSAERSAAVAPLGGELLSPHSYGLGRHARRARRVSPGAVRGAFHVPGRGHRRGSSGRVRAAFA